MRHAFAGPLLFIYELDDGLLADQYVSTVSRWSDDIWELTAETAGRGPSRLYWRFEILPGEWSTDERWLPLLNLAKRLVNSFSTVSMRGRPLKSTSLPATVTALRALMQFMAATGRSKFSQLTSSACDLYLDHAAATRRDEKGFLDASFSIRVDILCRIYEQGPLFRRHPEAVLPEAPFGGRTAYAVVKSLNVSVDPVSYLRCPTTCSLPRPPRRLIGLLTRPTT